MVYVVMNEAPDVNIHSLTQTPEAPVCLEGRSTPDHDGASSTVPRRKHLQWDLLVMPVTLEAIRTIQVTFFSRQLIKLSFTFQYPMFTKSRRESLWLGRKRGCQRSVLFFEPFSRRSSPNNLVMIHQCKM